MKQNLNFLVNLNISLFDVIFKQIIDFEIDKQINNTYSKRKSHPLRSQEITVGFRNTFN